MDAMGNPVNLPLIRLVAHDERGLYPDNVTMYRWQMDRFFYCEYELGRLGKKGHLASINIRLPEMEGRVSVGVVVGADAAASLEDFVRGVDGYDVPPHGPHAESFGFNSSDAAWLFPHRHAPALLYNPQNTDAMDNINQWFEFNQTVEKTVHDWPTAVHDILEMIGDNVIHSERRGLRRKIRATGRMR